MIQLRARAVFIRHLDLDALRGRPRGLVRCIFHEDRRPSLSVDLDRGLFHCFGCGEQGGLRRFAELVGERVHGGIRQAPRPVESEAARGRREVLEADLRVRQQLARWEPLLSLTAWLWAVTGAVTKARALASTLGETERTVELLAHAARLETLAAWAAHEMALVLAEGRAA
jgi:hypothetical protein